MGLNTLDLPPLDHILNTLECGVHCGHPMRRQPVISEFEVAISKKCPMNPGFTLQSMKAMGKGTYLFMCFMIVKCGSRGGGGVRGSGTPLENHKLSSYMGFYRE